MLENPLDDFFDAMPAIGAASAQDIQEEKKDSLLSREEQSRFSYRRQMNALRLAQEKSIREEDFEYGARPLRRAIQNKVEDTVAERMLDGTLKAGDTAKLSVKNDKLAVTK